MLLLLLLLLFPNTAAAAATMVDRDGKRLRSSGLRRPRVDGINVLVDTEDRSLRGISPPPPPAFADGCTMNGDFGSIIDAFLTPAYREFRDCADLECRMPCPAAELGSLIVGDMAADAGPPDDPPVAVPIAAGRGRFLLAAKSTFLPPGVVLHEPPPPPLLLLSTRCGVDVY